MKHRHRFIRNLEVWTYLEIFLVSAIASILGIRAFLKLTGYPKLEGGGLHIAHMLWGGLLMLSAIVILLTFLSKESQRLASILGGVGFGAFIDEVGKFVTSDNNYFFEPAVALIYVSFVLTFLVIHTIHTRWKHSDEEYLINALREMEQVALHDLDDEEKKRTLHYLERSDPAHPLVAALKQLVTKVNPIPTPSPGLWSQGKHSLRSFYARIAGLPGFPTAIAVFFIVRLAFTLAYGLALVFSAGFQWERLLDLRILQGISRRLPELSFVDVAQLAASSLAGIYTVLGVVRIRRSRLAAFEMFERSVLVSIFLTQVFRFYQEQFGALLGLLIDILILVAVRFVIEQERLVTAMSGEKAAEPKRL
jgi:hypothetical protein